MHNVICAIAKCENEYINDWCKYHLDLGFDDIYIFDNNIEYYEPIECCIDQSIMDKIHITKIPNAKAPFQVPIYDEFYHSHSFDWCAFIDIDEYIVINGFKNISEFFSQPQFKNANIISLVWHMYGDDGEIKRDRSIPVNKYFKKRITKYVGHGKSIIRGGVKNLKIVSSHYAKINDKTPAQTTPEGKTVYAEVGGRPDSSIAYINHYMTKTLEEFIDQKLDRGTDAGFPNRVIDFNYFWGVNEKTPQKVNYLKERGLL